MTPTYQLLLSSDLIDRSFNAVTDTFIKNVNAKKKYLMKLSFQQCHIDPVERHKIVLEPC